MLKNLCILLVSIAGVALYVVLILTLASFEGRAGIVRDLEELDRARIVVMQCQYTQCVTAYARNNYRTKWEDIK